MTIRGVLGSAWIAAAALNAAAQDAYVPNQGSDDLTVFAVHDPSDVATLPLGDQPHEGVAGLDGRYVFVSNRLDDTVSVFDATSRAEIDTDGDPGNGTTRIAVGGQPHGLAVTPDNRYVFVTNDATGDVSVIEVASLSVVSTVPEVGVGPHMVAISPDGTEAWTGNIGGGDVSILDVAAAIDDPANAVVCVTPGGVGPDCRIPTGSGAEGLEFTHDGRTVYVANGGADTVSVVDVATRTVVGTLTVAGSPRRVHVRPDGKRAYVSQLFGADVEVIDTTTHAILPTERIANVPNGLGMAFRADGALLYVSNFFSSSVTIVDLADTSQRETVAAGTNPDSVAVQREEVRGLRFASDRQTLTWTRQFLAERYAVYRGTLADLPAPGPCAADPDPSDLEFADADTPPVGSGFTYLVAIVTAADRVGLLGFSSAGDLRTVAAGCP